MAAPRQEEVFYTPEKVAKLAECVIQTIYRHLDSKQNRFPNARRIGRRKWLIPEDDVIAYLGFDPNETEIRIVR